MNLDEAMQAHVNWKMRLREYCRPNRREELDPAAVGKDNRCALGLWIHGEGEGKYGNSSEFKNLVTAHAEFHRAASQVVELVNGGKVEEGLKILDDPQSTFRSKTTEVIGLLSKLKKIQ
ncbi:MAG TPA: CZB domain-containing protein [Elusimicrobiota bacterium]|nr:CZB domain-containing protein [Elusimicrobiota bacterium]